MSGSGFPGPAMLTYEVLLVATMGQLNTGKGLTLMAKYTG